MKKLSAVKTHGNVPVPKRHDREVETGWGTAGLDEHAHYLLDNMTI